MPAGSSDRFDGGGSSVISVHAWRDVGEPELWGHRAREFFYLHATPETLRHLLLRDMPCQDLPQCCRHSSRGFLDKCRPQIRRIARRNLPAAETAYLGSIKSVTPTKRPNADSANPAVFIESRKPRRTDFYPTTPRPHSRAPAFELIDNFTNLAFSFPGNVLAFRLC